MRAISHGSRGQAAVETVLVLPIVVFLLFGIVYFSNVGTVAERTQIGVRYSALVGFAGASPAPYSAQAIYAAGAEPSGTCATPPPSALYHAAPFPGPTSAPYWNPQSVTTSCHMQTDELVGAQFLASRYITFGRVSVQAQAQMPNFYLYNSFGSNGKTLSGVQGWVHAAWPGAILACTMKTADAVKDALTAYGTASYGGNRLTILPEDWPPECR